MCDLRKMGSAERALGEENIFPFQNVSENSYRTPHSKKSKRSAQAHFRLKPCRLPSPLRPPLSPPLPLGPPPCGHKGPVSLRQTSEPVAAYLLPAAKTATIIL